MNTVDFRYLLTLQDPQGSPLGRPVILADMDVEPVREWVRFERFLRGADVPSAVSILPQWDDRMGEPFVGGLRAVCEGSEHLIPRTFFAPAARARSRQLLADGILKEGDYYRYLVTATRVAAKPSAERGRLSIEVEEDFAPWNYRAEAPEDLAELPLATVGREHGLASDLPVFVPEWVLDEAAELTLRDETVETGGVLIGFLCRHPSTERAGLVVTGQIAATDTVAGEAHLTFTPATWAAVSRALAARQDGSVIVGWWHSHPASQWCKPECSEEARAACPLKKSFFSDMDVNVHRAVFCQGYAVALVLTNTGREIRHALYGWREGMVQRRAFQVSGCRRPPESYEAPGEPDQAAESTCAAKIET